MALLTVRDDGWGRTFVAARDIAAGEVLLREKPIAAVTHNIILMDDPRRPIVDVKQADGSSVDGEVRYRRVVARCALPRCFAASDSTVGRVCQRCRWTLYCSEACRCADESVHARICDGELLRSPLLLPARLLAQGVRLPVLWSRRPPSARNPPVPAPAPSTTTAAAIPAADTDTIPTPGTALAQTTPGTALAQTTTGTAPALAPTTAGTTGAAPTAGAGTDGRERGPPPLGRQCLADIRRLLLPRFPEVPPGDVLRVCVACADAAFVMRTPTTGRLYGEALYCLPSYLNHSCDPPARYRFDGATIVVQTVRPMRAGEQIFVSYLDVPEMSPESARRDALRARLGDAGCSCERCTVPGRRALDALTLCTGVKDVVGAKGVAGLSGRERNEVLAQMRELHAAATSPLGFGAADAATLFRLAEDAPRRFGDLHACTMAARHAVLCAAYDRGTPMPAAGAAASAMRAALSEIGARGVVASTAASEAWCDLMHFLLEEPEWLVQYDPVAEPRRAAHVPPPSRLRTQRAARKRERERQARVRDMVHFLAVASRARDAVEAWFGWDALALDALAHDRIGSMLCFLRNRLSEVEDAVRRWRVSRGESPDGPDNHDTKDDTIPTTQRHPDAAAAAAATHPPASTPSPPSAETCGAT